MGLLDKINSPSDLRALPEGELPVLCAEIREFLVNSIAKSGGHLASNLGTVELTVALHRVYDTAVDRLVFDVGHQCYTHKLLTGRRSGFDGFRELGGMSGFPKPHESVHDAFIAGHASNSVSVALGMARARTALHRDYDVVAILGDGALSGGMAMEGLSDAGQSGEPLVIILNDNGMSISRSGGGLAELLGRIRIKPEYINFKRWYRHAFAPHLPAVYRFTHRLKRWLKQHVIPDNIFDDYGFEYLGPIDGHDIAKVETALRWAKQQGKPCLVHVLTEKGRGYEPAMRQPELFHGIGPFDPDTGRPLDPREDFSSVFGDELMRLAEENPRIAAVTAAMTEGTGLAGFRRAYPERFFDVGIAEGHACAMAGGMAAQGLIPVFSVYSTFLQRGYDMLIHDVALMGLHAVFCVDRAGIVGKDGQTHQGAFDVAYLTSVPGMTVYAPGSFAELRSMLRKAILEEKGPAAVRYPRGGEAGYSDDHSDDRVCVLREGTQATIVSYGVQTGFALGAAEILSQEGISAEVLKINRLAPLDITVIAASVRKTKALVIAEDVCAAGSMGEKILASLSEIGICPAAVRRVDLGDGILENGAPDDLRKLRHLDAEGIAQTVREVLHGED